MWVYLQICYICITIHWLTDYMYMWRWCPCFKFTLITNCEEVRTLVCVTALDNLQKRALFYPDWLFSSGSFLKDMEVLRLNDIQTLKQSMVRLCACTALERPLEGLVYVYTIKECIYTASSGLLWNGTSISMTCKHKGVFKNCNLQHCFKHNVSIIKCRYFVFHLYFQCMYFPSHSSLFQLETFWKFTAFICGALTICAMQIHIYNCMQIQYQESLQGLYVWQYWRMR